MEKNINIPIKDKSIILDIHIPTPPTPEGVWRDKGRDHVFFKRKFL